jgi:zinc and cadmium transporter
VGLSAAGSLGGLLAASLLLLLPAATRTRLVPPLVSYAVGALLGVALVAMLPEAIAMAPAPRVFCTLLGGILLFFVLEKLLLWRHCHPTAARCTALPAAGAHRGAVHNFIDGALIGASLVPRCRSA